MVVANTSTPWIEPIENKKFLNSEEFLSVGSVDSHLETLPFKKRGKFGSIVLRAQSPSFIQGMLVFPI
jgi:hypothetical protein